MTMDRRDDEDTTWLAAHAAPRPGVDDPLVRRTVARTVEVAGRRKSTPWLGLLVPAMAGVCVVGMVLLGQKPPAPGVKMAVAPSVVVVAQEEEADWLEEDLLEDGVQLAELETPFITEGDVGLEDLTDEELRALSRELKSWPGSAS